MSFENIDEYTVMLADAYAKDAYQKGYEAGFEDGKKNVNAVKHGRWIQISEYDTDDNANFQCSLCKYGETHTKNTVVNYCWHCGARMDGVENEVD